MAASPLPTAHCQLPAVYFGALLAATYSARGEPEEPEPLPGRSPSLASGPSGLRSG